MYSLSPHKCNQIQPMCMCIRRVSGYLSSYCIFCNIHHDDRLGRDVVIVISWLGI